MGSLWAIFIATVGGAFIRKGNRCVKTTEVKDKAMNMIQESDTNFSLREESCIAPQSLSYILCPTSQHRIGDVLYGRPDTIQNTHPSTN